MEKYTKPQTISELLAFCSEKGMPLRKMRFFIGEDYPEPKAFGIFQGPDGDFVVYKNKADGTRAVRYKGPDEAFAVNELYEKLKAETEHQRNLHGQSGVTRSAGGASKPMTKKQKGAVIAICAAVVMLVGGLIYREAHKPKRGYYRHNDSYYYYDTDDWYYYDNYAWILIDDEDLGFYEDYDNYRDYYLDEDYEGGFPVDDFRNSNYYDGYYEQEDDYDWGGNDDGGWDNWDAGAVDWNADW